MKILTKEQEDEAYQAHIDGGIRGGILSTAVFVPTTYLLNRYWMPFRSLTLPFKAFLLTSGIASVIMIESERAGRVYEKSQHAKTPAPLTARFDATGKPIVAPSADQVAAATADAPLLTRARTFVQDHQWSIIGTTWASGMGISLGYLMRQKHMSTMNKLVQARVYAQFITLAALLGTAAIVGTSHNSQGSSNSPEGRRSYSPNYSTPAAAEEKVAHHLDSLPLKDSVTSHKVPAHTSS